MKWRRKGVPGAFRILKTPNISCFQAKAHLGLNIINEFHSLEQWNVYILFLHFAVPIYQWNSYIYIINSK